MLTTSTACYVNASDFQELYWKLLKSSYISSAPTYYRESRIIVILLYLLILVSILSLIRMQI
jgi:hypothetical protein